MSQVSNDRNTEWLPFLIVFLGLPGVFFLLMIVAVIRTYSDDWQKVMHGLFAFGVWGLFFYFLIPRIASAKNPSKAVKIGGAVALSGAVVLGTFGISASLPNKVPDLGDEYLQALTSLCEGRGSGGMGISEASPYTENQGMHPIVFIADGEMGRTPLNRGWYICPFQPTTYGVLSQARHYMRHFKMPFKPDHGLMWSYREMRSSLLPADWLPDGREDLELVLCIFHEPKDKGYCQYNFGPTLDKLQHRVQFYLLAVNTGDLVASDTILGGEPECPGSVSSSRTDPVYGSKVDFDEYLEFVRDFVEK